MPITVRLDRNRNTILVECGARVSRLELNVAIVEAMHTAGYADGLPILIDFRRLEELPTAMMLQDFADAVQQSGAPAGARRAIVTSTLAGYGMARMLEAYTADLETEYRAFRELSEALAWIGDRGTEQGDSWSRSAG